MVELFLQELQYEVGEDPGPWISKLQRVQEAFGYDDARMLLLVEICVKKNRPATEFVRQFRRRTTTTLSSRCHRRHLQDVFAGFRRLHELYQRVGADKAVKWAMLHVGCQGKHNPRNVVSEKKLSHSPMSLESDETSESLTGEAEVLRFPENSFPINCGFGDFCVNDVLKFDQTLVYNNMSLKDGSVGKAHKRTIVGRVAHEAQGVEIARTSTARMSKGFSQSDEEPTYTIEVYWSRGVKPVDTSEPFIIKAQNLALLKPVRQRWGNEQNRVHETEKKLHNRSRSKALPKRCQNPKPSRRAENCTNLIY